MGRVPLMASSMELEKDRSFDSLVEQVIPAIKHEFDTVIRHLRPPPYPMRLTGRWPSAAGRCSTRRRSAARDCHGRYDGQRQRRMAGRAPRRRHRSRPARRRLGRASSRRSTPSPIAARRARSSRAGYAATPLTGVWANFPYLHNGSVPTLHHLLGPPSERPHIFEVMAARQFDRERVGQRLFGARRCRASRKRNCCGLFGGDRDWFNTAPPRSGNSGHDVWRRIRTDENRRALIEYLKTL